MFAKFLASRLAGPAIVALIVAVLVGFGSSFINARESGRWEALAKAHAQTIKSQETQLFENEALMVNYRLVIAEQSNAVDALKTAAEKGRTVYLTTYAKADERAKDADVRAAELLALTTTQTDELAQCRAARILMEQEIAE